MKELNQKEINAVSGAGIMAALDGIVDGTMTGALLAGKSAGAGGFIVGAIGQGLGALVGGIAGGALLGIYGLGHSREEVAEYAKNYRETIGKAPTSIGGSL